LTEQNPQAFKQYWWKRIACELHKMTAKLAPSRAAAARRAMFRLPTGASDEMHNYHTRYKPTCLLLSLIVVRIVIVNGILVMHAPPAFARGMPVHLRR
jgi:hypothetical protein